MSGLPNLPGYSFQDPTQTEFHLQQTLGYHNGYKIPRMGGKAFTRDKGTENFSPVNFDPSHIYGRTKSKSLALPQFTPQYVLYDRKCLTFKAVFQQSVVDSPDEFRRVRFVDIIYFLEDDTLTVIEPKVPNSGLCQGRLVRRGKIPKNTRGDYWHWKDLNIGKNIAIYGIVFHIRNCDLFTREYLTSQGIVVQANETTPADPYRQTHEIKTQHTRKTPAADDQLRRFFEYDGKVLKFKAVWDADRTESEELRKCEILYFLCDDTVRVKAIHGKNDGKETPTVLLRKTKLPKRYTDTPVAYPAIYLELSDAEVTEYYQPKDFLVGETIFILGRVMLLYDCDQFTRDYFKNALCIEQKQAVPVELKQPLPRSRQIQPHTGIGSLEDSLQSTLTVTPKRPRKNQKAQIFNTNKYLRYEMVMDCVHPEDKTRQFILSYSLADGTCKIMEPPVDNSGIIGGKYLRSTNIIKPGSDPLNPDFYTPVDFYIGAIITVFQQRFRIVGADLYVYRYMQANESKFSCEIIDNMRNYMFNKGYLKDDVKDTIQDNDFNERKWDVDMRDEQQETYLQKCYREQKVGERVSDPEYNRKQAELEQEYEESIKRKPFKASYGIKEANKTCAYPVHVGDVKEAICREDDEEYHSYTPKHVDTPEEVIVKYYTGVLKDHHKICDGTHTIECLDAPPRSKPLHERTETPTPIMVAKPDIVPGPCEFEKVTIADDHDRYYIDRYNLCNLKRDNIYCECTNHKY